jgi:hypothetical protein
MGLGARDDAAAMQFLIPAGPSTTSAPAWCAEAQVELGVLHDVLPVLARRGALAANNARSAWIMPALMRRMRNAAILGKGRVRTFAGWIFLYGIGLPARHEDGRDCVCQRWP